MSACGLFCSRREVRSLNVALASMQRDVEQTRARSARRPCETRSSAVVDRPRDASCLSVVVQYLERSLLLLVTSASDLTMRTIKFCLIVCGVTLRFFVINKIH